MKTTTLKKFFAFILLLGGMFLSVRSNAQCPHDKILVCGCHGNNYQCHCINPDNYNSWVYHHPIGCGGNARLSNNNVTAPNYLEVYPNLISTSANIFIYLKETQKVSVKVFDMTGRLVTTLADGVFEADENEITWNVSDINAGIYFIRMEAGNYLQTEKVSIIK